MDEKKQYFGISPVTNRVPYSSLMNSSVKNNPGDYIIPNNFVVILNEYVYGFQEISGIDTDYPYESLAEGGNPNPVFVHKAIASESFTILTLRRSMPIRKGRYTSKAFQTAAGAASSAKGMYRRSALLAAASLDPITTLENGPAIGFIQIFNRNYSKNVASFKFFSYGASKWTLGELDALAGSIVYESIDLVCDGVQRMSTDIAPSGIWNAFNSEIEESELSNLDELEKARSERAEQESDKASSNLNKFKESNEKKLKELEEERKKRAEELEKAKEEIDAIKKAWENELKEKSKKNKQ